MTHRQGKRKSARMTTNKTFIVDSPLSDVATVEVSVPDAAGVAVADSVEVRESRQQPVRRLRYSLGAQWVRARLEAVPDISRPAGSEDF